LSVRSSS